MQMSNYDNVILYDGVCGFCNTWVDLVLRIDKNGLFRFTALQSETGGRLLTQVGLSASDLSSVVLIKEDSSGALTSYRKSEAAVQVIKELDLPAITPLAVLISKLLPLSFKDDVLYDAVAKNRYRIMGKRSMERLDDLNQDRFLD
jgi:predicted DCC family thiol-disulfide oxidoreductase YuxK